MEIDLSALNKDAKKELYDFYRYLLFKYKNMRELRKEQNRKNDFLNFAEKNKISIPENYKLNREELHGR